MARYIARIHELAVQSNNTLKKDAAIIVKHGIENDDVLGEGYNTKETERGVNFHATLNAIVKASKNLADCTLYVKYYPCNECAKLILFSGIKKVVHILDDMEDNSGEDGEKGDDSRELFTNDNVKGKINIEKWNKDTDLKEYENRDNQCSVDCEEHKEFMDKAIKAGNENGTSAACIVIIVKKRKDIISCEKAQHPLKGLGLQPKETNSLYALHAESAAIIKAYNESPTDLRNCIIYCTEYPSKACGPLIVKSGIRRVIYKNDYDPKFTFQPFEEILVKSYDDIMQSSMTE